MAMSADELRKYILVGLETLFGLLALSTLVAKLFFAYDISWFAILFVSALTFGADRVRAAIGVGRPKKTRNE